MSNAPDYDVIIIGAGPAGSTTAKTLRDLNSDINVLLVDKADQFPRDKPCGGYIGAELLDVFPYLQEHREQFIESESYEGILHSPDLRYQVGGQTRMLGVLRSKFDGTLVSIAQQAGAHVRTRRRVKDIMISDKTVSIVFDDKEAISAHVVVGADGAASIISRRSGLHSGWESHQICRTVVKEFRVNPDFIIEKIGPTRPVHLYLKFNQLPGYAWYFPKANHINVGLGCFANFPIKLFDYFQLFIKLLKKWKMLPSFTDFKGIQAGICPTAGPIETTQSDRVILVGDAAGFVSPATGAGIIPGMVSGRLAAETIVHAFRHQRFDKNFLKLYQEKWERHIGRFKTEQLIQKIFLTNFCNLFIRIGEKDAAVRSLVASAQSHSPSGAYGSGVSIPKLLGRVLWALLKGSFGKL